MACAVVKDADGDPWLVFAAKHNRFHAAVAERMAKLAEVLPLRAEYVMRAREEAGAGAVAWRMSLLRAFADGLCDATREGGEVAVVVPGLGDDIQAEIRIEVEHGEPADGFDEAASGVSLMTARLQISVAGRTELEGAVIQTCLPFLQPDSSRIDVAYGKRGGLTVLAEVSHAKMIQLLSGVVADQELSHGGAQAPDRLHYVGIEFLVDGYVNGRAVRGVCGAWFVPTRDESADLPVCSRCETERPAAEAVVELLRRRASGP